ncbi:MAG TPA: acetylhydrolase [Crenalkalicoccus sp.]|nr:acetylhydrolase [Crenalkalicoccus sp.]
MRRRHLLPALLLLRSARVSATSLPAAWHDAARNRTLPVLIRLPRDPVPAPAVLISHGLGGSREGLSYLGRALAEAGFVAIHLQHPGSDTAVWRGQSDPAAALAATARDVTQAMARLRDGIFAVDELERRVAEPGPLHRRVDLARLAAAGHSFGAWTVQHLLGERLPGGARGLALPDRRLKAGVAISPIPPHDLPPYLAYARFAAPLLSITGTRDYGQIGNTTPADRLMPFHAIRGVPQALLVLDGATHMSFADEAVVGRHLSDGGTHVRVSAVTIAFLRAVLLGDAAALQLLRTGAPGVLAGTDRLQLKGFAGAG